MYIFTSWFWAEFFGYSLSYEIQMIFLNPPLFVLFSVPAGALLYALIKFVFKAGPRRVTHGSASWGTLEDAQKAGLAVGYLSEKEIAYLKKEKKQLPPRETMWTTVKTIVGKIADTIIGADYHTIFISPPRSGKGTLILIPNILAYPGSIVNNDIKGENYAITARRRREMGQIVYKFDPYNNIKDGIESARFNPLDYIEDSDEGYTRALVLADIIGEQDGGGKENDFFTKSGKIVILLYIMYTCIKCDKEIRNLTSVRDFSMLPFETAKAIFMEMTEMDNFNGEIRKNANELLSMIGESDDPKVYLSVKSTVNTMLTFLGDKRVADSLSATDFKPENFRYIPSSLYIIVDATNLQVSAMLMRIVYTYVIKLNITMEPPLEMAEQGIKMLKYPLKFFMDEFAQLKKFEIVQETMPLSAGMGVLFCIILQSVAQLQHFYDKGGEEFLDNTTRIFMGAESNGTAEVISKACGKTTVFQLSKTLLKAGLFRCFNKYQYSYSETARDLITVGEALQMKPEEPLLLKGKIKPLRLKATPYFENPAFNVKDKNGKEVVDEEGRVKKMYDEFTRF